MGDTVQAPLKQSLPSPLANHGFLADAHCDSVTAGLKGRTPQIDWKQLPAFADLQYFAIFLEEEQDATAAAAECDRYYEHYQDLLQTYTDQLTPVRTGAELSALQPGHTGALLAMENCAPLLNDGGEAVYSYFERGFRSFGLVWNHENGLAGGALTDAGLTKQGSAIVRELSKLPVVIDLAHCNRRSFYQVLETAAQPVLVSHACCAARCRHPRNLDDDQLRTLAQAGGLVGITFARSFLFADGEATIDTIVDHVVHAAYTIGPEWICLGSDFDGTDLPADMQGQADLPIIWHKLRERGFSEAEAKGISGENLRRFTLERLT